MRFPAKLTLFALACAVRAQIHAQAVPAPQSSAQPANAYSTAPWPGPGDTPLGQQIRAMVNEPAVSHAHWGIAITAMDGTPIFGLNQGQFFRPASNAMLFTTATALALLGPTRRFETRVITTGAIDASGTLHGDLRLEGRGDANFGEEDIPYVRPADSVNRKPPVTNIPDIEDLASKIAAKGIKSVDGGIIASDAYFANTPYPNGWAWDDLIWAYAAPVSAFTIHGNELDVTVTPAAIGRPALITVVPDDVAYYTIDNQVLTTLGPGSCDARLNIAFDESARTLHLRGAIAPSHAPCKEELAIQRPAHYAGVALKTALERHGIHVNGDITVEHQQLGAGQSTDQPLTPEENNRAGEDLRQRFSAASIDLPPWSDGPDPGPNPTPAGAGQTLLATHAAPALRADLTLTNKVSNNLHSEILLRNVASALCQPRTLQNSLRIRKQFLIWRAGIDPADFILYDGSGRSGEDLVAPRAMAQLLRFAATQPWFTVWKASLSVAGEDDMLGSFDEPPLKGHVTAMAGALGESRALSGYLNCASGKTLIFAIMTDAHGRGSADQQVMDRILAAIAAAN